MDEEGCGGGKKGVAILGGYERRRRKKISYAYRAFMDVSRNIEWFRLPASFPIRLFLRLFIYTSLPCFRLPCFPLLFHLFVDLCIGIVSLSSVAIEILPIRVRLRACRTLEGFGWMINSGCRCSAVYVSHVCVQITA